ncbi:hypothetical protein FNJ20_23540, partial [Salmonella enterica subsp. salamae]|nr:hypothetical protein [Salmonella enterica subsp. salamae]
VKKACTKCDGIVEAPAPSRPIERGIAGPARETPGAAPSPLPGYPAGGCVHRYDRLFSAGRLCRYQIVGMRSSHSPYTHKNRLPG